MKGNSVCNAVCACVCDSIRNEIVIWFILLCVASIPLCPGPCTEVVYCLLSRKNRLQNPADACDQIRDTWMTVR